MRDSLAVEETAAEKTRRLDLVLEKRKREVVAAEEKLLQLTRDANAATVVRVL